MTQLSFVCSCVVCKDELTHRGIHSHYIRKHTDGSKRDVGKGSQKFQLKCSCLICQRQLTVQNLSAHIQRHSLRVEPKQCPKCKATHYLDGKFCSRSCGNSRVHSAESNQSRREKMSGREIERIYQKLDYTKVDQCSHCNRWFLNPNRKTTCSEQCKKQRLSLGGRKSASVRATRSKDEIALYLLCQNYFRHVTHNNSIFNGWDADILIHDLKIAILWNGPWHYQTMPVRNHSLAQVQNRDRIKIAEIINHGWAPIVYEDRHFTPITAFNDLLMRVLDSNQD